MDQLRNDFHDSGDSSVSAMTRRVLGKMRPDVKMARLAMLVNNIKKSPWLLSRCKDNDLHLQAIVSIIRPDDSIKVAVKLESSIRGWYRYVTIVSTVCDAASLHEESILLGVDISANASFDRTSEAPSTPVPTATIGLAIPIGSDIDIRMDGDGGFCVVAKSGRYIFRPVSVQAMWSALQSLMAAILLARQSRQHDKHSGTNGWMTYYLTRIASSNACVMEWNRLDDIESPRDSLNFELDESSENVKLMLSIKRKLREIMSNVDLEEVTSKYLRERLEESLKTSMTDYRRFIEEEMVVVMRQMDSPSIIFDHLYLGSEWNASNLNELKQNRVGYILNVTREIDNFFPGVFKYCNVRVYDNEETQLLRHWNSTYQFIADAKKNNSAVLVHCKMGVSRSASTVIAYIMKEYGWSLEEAYQHVKQRRGCIQPNPGFMQQLITYQGILDASKQRNNKLFRTRSADDLTDPSVNDPSSSGSDQSGNDDTEYSDVTSPVNENEGTGNTTPRPGHKVKKINSDRLPRTKFDQPDYKLGSGPIRPVKVVAAPRVPEDSVTSPGYEQADKDSPTSPSLDGDSATFAIDNSTELNDILEPDEGEEEREERYLKEEEERASGRVENSTEQDDGAPEMHHLQAMVGWQHADRRGSAARSSAYDFSALLMDPSIPQSSMLRKWSLEPTSLNTFSSLLISAGIGRQHVEEEKRSRQPEFERNARSRRKESLDIVIVPTKRSSSVPSRRVNRHAVSRPSNATTTSRLPLSPTSDWLPQVSPPGGENDRNSGCGVSEEDEFNQNTDSREKQLVKSSKPAPRHKLLSLKRSATLREDPS